MGCDWQTMMVTTSSRCGMGMKASLTRFAVCLLNVVGTPWCLAFHLVSIYLCPCIAATLDIVCCGSKMCTMCRFEDRNFPPDDSSLGEIKARITDVEWRRLETDQREALFENGVEPNDVCQGALGNCWLLSAAACLAEFDGAIERLFVNKQANARGKYKVRLFDARSRKWRIICVDDRFPTSKGKPIFSRPHGNELWVLLLEKAMAKFCGSYAQVESGLVLWAFQAMTGDKVAAYICNNGNEWEHLSMEPKDDDQNKRAVAMYRSGKTFDKDSMFELLCKYDKCRAVLGAASRGSDETLTRGRSSTTSGIVPGHAYSIVSAAKKKNCKLLKLRNPWGTFEFKGKWADGDKAWTDHPEIARAFNYKPDDTDGTFFMEWDDFCRHFDHIDVCLRTQGMSEFILQVDERYGLFGPTVGCCKGICSFCCMCEGLWKMWCGRESTESEISKLEEGLARPTGNVRG